MEGEVVLPGLQRLGSDQLGDPGDGAGLPHHELLRAGKAGRAEEGLPVEARRLGAEGTAGPVVVALAHVSRLLPAPVGGGDAFLEREDALGAASRVGHAGELQHRFDVLPVLAPDRGHRRRGVEIVAPVRHAKTALEQERRVPGGVVQVLRHPEAEQVLGVEVGVVQRVDVGPQCGAKEAGEPMTVADGPDGVERRPKRREAGRLDRGRVQEGGIVVGHPPQIRPGRRLGVRGIADEIGDLAVGLLDENRARPVGAPIGRNLGTAEPRAVGVFEERVARLDVAVHAGRIQADGRRGLSRESAGDNGEGGEQPKERDADHGLPMEWRWCSR